jgi:Zn-dependent M16 (insulinase) family peptidase
MEAFVTLILTQVQFYVITYLWKVIIAISESYAFGVSYLGVFSFLSYRDPNLLKTLDVYDGTSDFLRGLVMDDDALTKAIIGTIGDVDSYQLPDAKGYSRYVDSTI